MVKTGGWGELEPEEYSNNFLQVTALLRQRLKNGARNIAMHHTCRKTYAS
jgi:hypothetical protein